MDDVPDTVLRVAWQTMRSATDRGWYGIAGLDILHREDGGVALLIDPNFRVTSATTISLLRRHIRESTGNRFASSVSLKPKGKSSFEEALRGARPLLDNGDVIIVGGAKLDGHSKLYGAVLGNNPDQMARARESLGDYYGVV